MAYLKQQYKVVVIVFVIMAVFFAVLAYVFHVQNPWVPFAFLTGGFFSGLAGFIGMKTATFASGRTANAARRSLNAGLKVAFRSGAVMGLTVVGLGLLDIAQQDSGQMNHLAVVLAEKPLQYSVVKHIGRCIFAPRIRGTSIF